MKRHHLFLSPHPDDAVLSCGGLIYTLCQQEERVSVWTIMAQDAPKDVISIPYIQSLHQRWGLGDTPYAHRRTEDQYACHALGVDDVTFGDWVDAIYRVGQNGNLLYTSDDDLFGEVKEDDPLHEALLDVEQWQDVTDLYVPLAVGQHVDHQIVHWAARRSFNPLLRWHFYEDYPYSATSAEVFFAHGGNEARLYGIQAVQKAISNSSLNLQSQILEMPPEAIEAKIKAIAHYQSQISTFWPSLTAMAKSVKDYHCQIGSRIGFEYAESYWILKDSVHKEI